MLFLCHIYTVLMEKSFFFKVWNNRLILLRIYSFKKSFESQPMIKQFEFHQELLDELSSSYYSVLHHYGTELILSDELERYSFIFQFSFTNAMFLMDLNLQNQLLSILNNSKLTKLQIITFPIASIQDRKLSKQSYTDLTMIPDSVTLAHNIFIKSLQFNNCHIPNQIKEIKFQNNGKMKYTLPATLNKIIFPTDWNNGGNKYFNIEKIIPSSLTELNLGNYRIVSKDQLKSLPCKLNTLSITIFPTNKSLIKIPQSITNLELRISSNLMKFKLKPNGILEKSDQLKYLNLVSMKSNKQKIIIKKHSLPSILFLQYRSRVLKIEIGSLPSSIVKLYIWYCLKSKKTKYNTILNEVTNLKTLNISAYVPTPIPLLTLSKTITELNVNYYVGYINIKTLINLVKLVFGYNFTLKILPNSLPDSITYIEFQCKGYFAHIFSKYDQNENIFPNKLKRLIFSNGEQNQILYNQGLIQECNRLNINILPNSLLYLQIFNKYYTK